MTSTDQQTPIPTRIQSVENAFKKHTRIQSIEKAFQKHARQETGTMNYDRPINCDTYDRMSIESRIYIAHMEEMGDDWKAEVSEWLEAIGMNKELVWGPAKEHPVDSDSGVWELGAETQDHRNSDVQNPLLLPGPHTQDVASMGTLTESSEVSREGSPITMRGDSIDQSASEGETSILLMGKCKCADTLSDTEAGEDSPADRQEVEEMSVPVILPKKRKYRKEADKKLSHPKITTFPLKDEWKTDEELITITAIKDPLTRHYEAPYCYTYQRRLLAQFKYLAQLLNDSGEYKFPETSLKRVVDSYPKWIKGVRNYAGANMDGEYRLQFPKVVDDLHNDTPGSHRRGRFRKSLGTEDGKVISKMAKDDLLHHAYFDTEPVKIGAADAALKVNKKTGQPVPHKRIKEAHKDVQDALMRVKKREAEAANHEFEVTHQLQAERRD